MNGTLLNIWREIGAYLRYGDAKCLFLSGLNFSLLISFVKYKLIDESLKWNLLSILMGSNIDTKSWIAIISFFVGFVISALVVMPTLSEKMVRVRIINNIGSCFHCGRVMVSNSAVSYFSNIAKFENANTYESAVRMAMSLPDELNVAEKDIINQIFIIAQIASSKFFAANISIVSIVVGLFFAII